MLKDIKLMIDFVREISCSICEKEIFFYDFETDTWYSREHCRNVEFEEIIEWLKDNIYPIINEPVESISEDCFDCIKYREEVCDGENEKCASYETFI